MYINEEIFKEMDMCICKQINVFLLFISVPVPLLSCWGAFCLPPPSLFLSEKNLSDAAVGATHTGSTFLTRILTAVIKRDVLTGISHHQLLVVGSQDLHERIFVRVALHVSLVWFLLIPLLHSGTRTFSAPSLAAAIAPIAGPHPIIVCIRERNAVNMWNTIVDELHAAYQSRVHGVHALPIRDAWAALLARVRLAKPWRL